MAFSGLNIIRKYSDVMKKTIHCATKTLAQSTIESVEGVEPISMSFNIYKKRRNNENNIPLLIMHGLFGSKSNWNSLSKAINEVTCRQPDYLEKLIIVDISPVSSSTQMLGMTKYFEAMKSVNLEGVETLSEARKKANEQLSQWIPELEVRQFLLTNLVKKNGKYHWRINLDVLEKAFHDRIMDFPFVVKCFEKPVLFIGGSKSDYLRQEDHCDILKIFPKAKFEYLDTGHWVHAEKPNEFLQSIATFLKE